MLSFFNKGKARFSIQENFTYRLTDKDGNVKQLWKDNAIGARLLAFFRSTTAPAYLKQQGLRIPFLTGSYVSELKVCNLVTNAGKAGVASRINGAGSEAAFTYIAIGIGTTAAAAGDTALQTEITTNGGQRAAATASRTTTDVTNDTARLVLTFNFTGSFAVTEAGALNASSSGVLLNRQVFSAVNVASGDSLQITIDIDVD